jgi:Zn-dependent metalloprotease
MKFNLAQNPFALTSNDLGQDIPCEGIFSNGSSSVDVDTLVSKRYGKNFIKISSRSEYLSGDFFRKYRSHFGISPNITFKFVDEWQNVSGNSTFTKYQQYFNDIKVEDGIVTEDFVNCLDFYLHGFVLGNINANNQINYDSTAILNILQTNYDVTNTMKITFELIYSGICAPTLAYKVHVDNGYSTKHYYFNVNNGTMIKVESNIRSANAPTIDYGTKNIADTKVSNEFLLIDEAKKITTENILAASIDNPGIDHAAFFQVNPDARTKIPKLARPNNATAWTTRLDHETDDAATFQAHYSGGKVWDFYALFGHNGPGDGKNRGLYIGANLNKANAFGTRGGVQEQHHISLGLKQGVTYSKHDIVGHEWAHTLISATSDFKNSALEESFCDIMGVSAAQNINDPTNGSLLEFGVGTAVYRSLSNPSFTGGLTHFSQSTAGKNEYQIGGIQNKWFSLLILGGAITQPNGTVVSVSPIGWIKARTIAFDNLKNKLSGNVDFADARAGSILAAIQIYGECSFEVQQVTNAWAAVGVGAKYIDDDGVIIKGDKKIQCKEALGHLSFEVCGPRPIGSNNYTWYYPLNWNVLISGPNNRHIRILNNGTPSNNSTEVFELCVKSPWYDKNGNGKQDANEKDIIECIFITYKDCGGENPGPCEKNGVAYFGNYEGSDARSLEKGNQIDKTVQDRLTIYPSASDDNLFVINGGVLKICEFELINTQGKIVSKHECLAPLGKMTINLEGFESGLYIVKYKIENESFVKKFVKI